jgi:hypothetical protein
MNLFCFFLFALALLGQFEIGNRNPNPSQTKGMQKCCNFAVPHTGKSKLYLYF